MAETDRILGYFLDEAQEHLHTIEEGLILPMSLAEPAKIKEVFRAAHSIKGGAAMLGLEVVHQLGNHFEQAFKAIKDRAIPVDEKLQDLLLEGLEILRLSIQMVQHGQTVPTDLLKEAVFAKITKRIQRSGGETTTDDADLPFTDPAIEQVFGNYVNQKLQQFVDVCKKTQPEAVTKQELQPICQKIGSLGESFEYLAWTNLLISCRLAVNNPLNGVVQLQEVIPKAIHQAQMLVMAGKHHTITSTPELEILLAPNAISNTRTQTGLSAYDTLDSISGVWDDVVIDEDESSDLHVDKPQHTSADFLFEPQMVSTETINDDDVGDSELDEFMQLFDEELLFDGTWVQNEDILTHEDLEYAELDISKDLWDADIATRPISNFLVPMESPFTEKETVTQQLPQFDFEQASDSELFIEDVTDTAVKPSPIRPTAVIDWSGLLADIPDQVMVDYEEPSQPPPNLPFAIEKVPIELTNDFLGDLPASLPAQIKSANHDHNFSDPFATDPFPNDSFLSDFSDLPFGLDLEDSSFSPPDCPQLKPIDADYLKELAMFDDLLADTKTTDVDLADLEQMIANGNLEEELDLENIEDFSPASVNSEVNSKLLINFDDFLTEAKTTVNNTTNFPNSTNYQPAHAGTEHSDVMTAPAIVEAETSAAAATLNSERAATEADLEDLDLLDFKSIDSLADFNYELDEVLAGLNMLDTSDADEQSTELVSSISELFMDDSYHSLPVNEAINFSDRDGLNKTQLAGNIDELASLDLSGVDFDFISAEQSPIDNLNAAELDSNSNDLDINSGLDLNSDLVDLDLGELNNNFDDSDINSGLDLNSDLVDLDLGELNNNFDGLDINSELDLKSDLMDLDLGEPNSKFDDLDINSDSDLNSDLVSLDLGELNSSFGDVDDLLSEPVIGASTDFGELLAEETFSELDAFLTVPPADLPIFVASAAVASIPTNSVVSFLERKAAAPKASRSKQRTFEQTMRVSVKNLNNLNNLTGELVVNRNTLEQDQNRMRQFLDKLLLEVQKLTEVGRSMQDLYEKSLLESSLLASRQQSQQAKSMVPGSGISGEAEYDPLEMDKFTPVHLISQQMIELTVRIRESTSDIEFVVDSSTEVTRSLRQITSQLQEDLNKSRMLPFSQTSDRLQRGVRDNGLKYGKEVDLRVEGSDTLIDKVILESLNDPLIHMVNNAIAHGIESPAQRLAAGKPAEGVITINATHQGTQTIISVKDDGAGIDVEQVKNKAIEKGLITPARAITMTKQEVYELLFLPSFSTKDQADELAGRGVGMDVVLSSLQEIRGTITTASKLGKGTVFTIRLPLALSITKALMASNKDVGIAFPMDGIEDTLSVKPYSIIENAAGQKFFPWRDQQMLFRPLSDLLAFNRPMKRVNYYGAAIEDTEQSVSIIVLRSGGDLVAVEVDRVLGEQEIVIKPLQGPAPKPLGIAGATVLGDGRIIPIADVLELVDLASGKLEQSVNQTWSIGDIPEDQTSQREPMVLVVDDSITVRQLLSLTFTKAGYRVEQARDGQEAWDKLRAGLPCDIIFCDIEMPRMDGLELLSKVQADEVIRQIPMAMLTSRGSDRHRQIASQLGASGYFIKPYLEDALLEAVKRMLKGEVLAIV